MSGHLVSYDPSNGEKVGEVFITPVEKIDEVVANARVAAREWRALAVEERVRLIKEAFARFEPDADKLAVLLS